MKTKVLAVKKQKKIDDKFFQEKSTNVTLLAKKHTKEDIHKPKRRIANVILPDIE